MNLSFWLVWGFDALIALAVIYFFMVGLGDRSVSSFNIGLWITLLLVVAGVLLGSLWLKSANHLSISKALLWLMAIPGLFYLFFILIVVIGKPRWN